MEDRTNVSLAALDSALTHMQEANKRLGRLFMAALAVIAIMFCTLMYFLMNYEIVATDVTLDSHEGPANYNYIGNDGDIDNGSSEGTDNNN